MEDGIKIKYVLHPGTVVSKNDGEEDYISFYRLCQLYKLNPYDCADDSNPTFGLDTTNAIHLFPREDGDYSLEKLVIQSPYTQC